MTRPVRIANFSGFYGDRCGIARELLDGPDRIDVLTGDYLAELTMLLLWKAKQRDPELGYAATFLDELTPILRDCLERNVKIVTNAGGLNPRSLVAHIEVLASRLGVAPKVALVEGDDVLASIDRLSAEGCGFENLDTGMMLRSVDSQLVTANVYLGGWGIAAALEHGADIVITGRVADASLAVGPAAWWHGWERTSFDELAGALVAGHVIECGPQCTGGNYSFFDELPDARYPGYPIAEIASDGSSVITKQKGTGGTVTIGTVTAQLLYEIASPAYANPDVVAHFDSIQLDATEPDRVSIGGVRGSRPPDYLKLAINCFGGYRNTMSMVITGLDVNQKAAQAVSMLEELLGGTDQFDDFAVQLVDTARPNSDTNPGATSLLRVTVRDQDREKVGRRFTNAVVALSLASYSGFYTTTPPQEASAYGVFWPTRLRSCEVLQTVTLPNGRVLSIPHTEGCPWTEPAPAVDEPDTVIQSPVNSHCRTVALGEVCGARSGDKGGNANIGIWARDDATYEWLRRYLTAARLRGLLSAEEEPLEVTRYLLPNIRALNFVVHRILGAGVASSNRYDPQAKGLGEYVRSRLISIPISLLRYGTSGPCGEPSHHSAE